MLCWGHCSACSVASVTVGWECRGWWRCGLSDVRSVDVGARSWRNGKVVSPVVGCCPIAWSCEVCCWGRGELVPVICAWQGAVEWPDSCVPRCVCEANVWLVSEKWGGWGREVSGACSLWEWCRFESGECCEVLRGTWISRVVPHAVQVAKVRRHPSL